MDTFSKPMVAEFTQMSREGRFWTLPNPIINKLQKLEDALFEQMLTAADLAYRTDRRFYSTQKVWKLKLRGEYIL